MLNAICVASRITGQPKVEPADVVWSGNASFPPPNSVGAFLDWVCPLFETLADSDVEIYVFAWHPETGTRIEKTVTGDMVIPDRASLLFELAFAN